MCSPRSSLWIWVLSLCSYHIFQVRSEIYCVWNYTSLKKSTDVSSQGWAQGWKSLSCQAKLSTELLSSMSDACWGWLWHLKESSPLTRPAQQWHRTDVTWSQLTPAVSPGLPKLRDCKVASACPAAEGVPFSRHFVNAVGVQRPWGRAKGSTLWLHWVRDTYHPWSS